MLLHVRDEQEVKLNIAGALLHSGHCYCDDVCADRALDLEDAGVQWAPASGTRTAHAFAHARLAEVNREPVLAKSARNSAQGRIARQLAQA